MVNEFQRYIAQLVERQHLNIEESSRAMQIMLLGGATPAQIAAFLVAMRMKGETPEEITGAVQSLRAKALPFSAPENAIDTCGTGGDHSGSLNISTAVAIVVAACDVPVVKHGNRSVSSRSGSADVLEALGVNLNASHEQMEHALASCNLCFLLAGNYHKSLRHIAPIRQELKLRTMFNLLGPLVNPAMVKRQLLGVYNKELLKPMAQVLNVLGALQAWVVYGADGMDELSPCGVTYVASLENGVVTEFEVTPAQAGLPLHPLEALQGGDATYNAHMLERLLAGHANAYRDAVLFNAAAALLIAGKCSHLTEGVMQASHAIDSGQAREVLNILIRISAADTV